MARIMGDRLFTSGLNYSWHQFVVVKSGFGHPKNDTAQYQKAITTIHIANLTAPS